MHILIAYCEHSTTVCTAGRTHLQLAIHPNYPHPLPPTHPLIHDTHDITLVGKTSLKSSSEYCMAEFSSYIAAKLLYLYSKSGMATMKHRRTTVVSIFQNGISRNRKCDNLVCFCKSTHKQFLMLLAKDNITA